MLTLRRTSSRSAYHEFVDSIAERRLPMATGAQDLKVMQILEGIYKNAERGKEVRYKI